MKKTIMILCAFIGLTAMVNLQAQTVSEPFTTSQTFVVPADVFEITVEAWGGGGAGGGSTAAGLGSARGGAGGGGGGFAFGTINVTPGQSLNIVVAAPVSGVVGADGPGGNDSYIEDFDGVVIAYGGFGGTANTAGGSPAGGAGGSGIGTTVIDGGNGDPGATGFGVDAGDGGDGANDGGTGGAGLTEIGQQGSGGNGNPPGGGGGGGRSSSIVSNVATQGGTGARGEIILTWTPDPDPDPDPLPFPVANWSLYIGIALMALFMVIRFRRVI